MAKTDDLFRLVSRLIEHSDEDWKILQEERARILSWSPEIVKTFYDVLYGIEETRAVFQPGERPKVEKTLELWVESMVSGRKGPEFWDHQWFVALQHIKRGTRNLYMLGMMNRVQQLFLHKCMQHYPAERATRIYSAFLRVSGVISALIAECYDAVVESSTREGMAKVGVNAALLERIKGIQIKKMLDEVAMR